MKIGCIQFEPSLGNLDDTIKRLETLIPDAAGADLIVLPELANSGYNFISQEQAWDSAESIENSRFINFLQHISKKHQFHIVSGFNERLGNKLYNSAVLIGPTGVLGKYQKLHLFYNEFDFFEPGDVGLPVFDVNGVKIGIQVCFDWMYPEDWRILALQGADIICHPSNLVLPGLAQKAVPIHALINRVFTITANRIGTEGDLTFTGLSTIANPIGEVLAQAAPDEAAVLVVEIDLEEARQKQITPRNHIFNDRRPDQYHQLTAPKGK